MALTAKGPTKGSLYTATVTVEPCDDGFKARVTRVLLLKLPSPTGTEVTETFPEFIRETSRLAERAAAAHFEVWAKIQTLGL